MPGPLKLTLVYPILCRYDRRGYRWYRLFIKFKYHWLTDRFISKTTESMNLKFGMVVPLTFSLYNKKGFTEIRILKKCSNRYLEVHDGNWKFCFYLFYEQFPLVRVYSIHLYLFIVGYHYLFGGSDTILHQIEYLNIAYKGDWVALSVQYTY